MSLLFSIVVNNNSLLYSIVISEIFEPWLLIDRLLIEESVYIIKSVGGECWRIFASAGDFFVPGGLLAI